MPKEERFPTSFMWGDERVELEYRPPAPAEFDSLERKYPDEYEYARQVTLLLLTRWNIEDDNGNIVPITREQLAAFPDDFLVALNAAVMDDFGKRIAEMERGGNFHA